MDEYEVALLAERGGVGMRIDPRRLGASIQPRYVGAPVEMAESLGETPVKISANEYMAAENTFFGIGQTTILAGAVNQQVKFEPDRPLAAIRFMMPSTVIGLLLNQVKINGTDLLPGSLGVPCEFFSEVSTAPNIDWLTINTTPGVTFFVSNPTAGALIFQGAFYGTQARS